MQPKIKIPLRSLDETMLRDLQEKYPEAEISIEVHKNKEDRPLSETAFWEVIALFDWTKEADDEAVIAPAVAHLVAQPVRHILEFADMLSEKLYALDRRVYAKHIGKDAWKDNHYFSVDNFLYARCCVVANGKELYEKVVANPTHIPKDLTFEALLYLPSVAYQLKMNKAYQYMPTCAIETYSNEEGWVYCKN